MYTRKWKNERRIKLQLIEKITSELQNPLWKSVRYTVEKEMNVHSPEVHTHRRYMYNWFDIHAFACFALSEMNVRTSMRRRSVSRRKQVHDWKAASSHHLEILWFCAIFSEEMTKIFQSIWICMKKAKDFCSVLNKSHLGIHSRKNRWYLQIKIRFDVICLHL